MHYKQNKMPPKKTTTVRNTKTGMISKTEYQSRGAPHQHIVACDVNLLVSSTKSGQSAAESEKNCYLIKVIKP